MHLTFKDVNHAFAELVGGIYTGEIPTIARESRNGDVLVVEEPVTITYQEPTHRVLFNRERDCNPFFHLYESLWMLAGRNDVAPLSYYSSKIADIASDDGKTFNGAYGYRWRHAPVMVGKYKGFESEQWSKCGDQLTDLVDHLRMNPTSRRAVLQMWNVQDDLLSVGEPLCYSKDVCCNLSVMFLMRDGKLDMTVTNRSNDLVLGCLGANVVHFSILQEYMANCLGVEVGVYNQFTNNLHAYTWNWDPERWLKEYKPPQQRNMHDPKPTTYQPDFKHIQLVEDKENFDKAVQQFVEYNKDGNHLSQYTSFEDPFLDKVAQPMMQAFHMHKQRDYSAATHWLERVEQTDWQLDGYRWINKRRKGWESKQREEKQEASSK